MATPLIIGLEEKAALKALAEKAMAEQVDIKLVMERINDPIFKAAHMDQMTAQTIKLPFDFMVTYSVEYNHPDGNRVRHMSMVSPIVGRLPTPHAVMMIAAELGFVGEFPNIQMDHMYLEDLTQGQAVNALQVIRE